MPIPKPRKNEDRDKFIARCISKLRKEDPDRTSQQITAICFQQWKDRNKEKGIFIEH